MSPEVSATKSTVSAAMPAAGLKKRRAPKIRVFEGVRGLEASSGVLPSGGAIATNFAETNKTVDHAISHVDRERVKITRKPAEDHHLFEPLILDTAGKTNRGKPLHTDPFAENRDRAVFRKSKAKVATPRGPERPLRRQLKTATLPEREDKMSDFICPNGTRHTSPKRVTKRSFETTINKEQKPKNFDGNRRFIHSPERARAAANAATAGGSVTRTERPASIEGVIAPLALTQVALKQESSSTLVSPVLSNGSSTYRSISNAFFDQQTVLTQAPETGRRPSTGIKQFPAQITMEGVFSPMRNGRVPRPQPTVAPWARDEPTVYSRPGAIKAASVKAIAPFATTAQGGVWILPAHIH